MASGTVDVAVRVNSACGRTPMGKPLGRVDFRACNDSACAESPVRYSFKRHETIGTGGSGSVYSGSLMCGEASDPSASIEVAIKAVRRVGLGKRAQMYLAREIAVHKALSHPNICKFISQTYDKDFVYIVMEILKGGDLYSVLKRQRSGFDEKVSLTITSQVLCALKQMHMKGISHRDIKLENIVFSHEPDFLAPGSLTVKLIDFGLACVRNPKAAPEDRMSSEKCGTVRYAAPEVVLEPSYLPEQVDIWSAGIVLYSMIARCNPYNGKTDKDVLHNIEHSELQFRGPAWEHVSEATKKLIRRMLSKRSSDRPSAAEALDEVEAILKRLSDEGVLCTAKSWLSNIGDFLTPNGSRSNDISQIGSSVTSLKGPGLSKKSDDEDGKSSSDGEEGQARPVVDSWMTIVRNMVTMVGDR